MQALIRTSLDFSAHANYRRYNGIVQRHCRHAAGDPHPSLQRLFSLVLFCNNLFSEFNCQMTSSCSQSLFPNKTLMRNYRFYEVQMLRVLAE
jgi:hypothetical protein